MISKYKRGLCSIGFEKNMTNVIEKAMMIESRLLLLLNSLKDLKIEKMLIIKPMTPHILANVAMPLTPMKGCP